MSIGLRLHDAQGTNTKERADSAGAGFLSAQVALAYNWPQAIEPAALTPGFAHKCAAHPGAGCIGAGLLPEPCAP